MDEIDLQSKTIPKTGNIEIYWFENELIGLQRTLFHRICIPLEPFDSRIEYEPQPVETEIIMEWLNLNLQDPTNMDGINLISTPENGIEVSVYIGSAHNPCDIKRMSIKKIEGQRYEIDCGLYVDFEYEGVAKNEEFNFKTLLELDPNIKG